MEKRFITNKKLLLLHKDGKALDILIREYCHLFDCIDRVSENMLQITSPLEPSEFKQLGVEGKLLIFECDHEEREITLNDVLDKISSSKNGIDSLNSNERMVLYSASK